MLSGIWQSIYNSLTAVYHKVPVLSKLGRVLVVECNGNGTKINKSHYPVKPFARENSDITDLEMTLEWDSKEQWPCVVICTPKVLHVSIYEVFQDKNLPDRLTHTHHFPILCPPHFLRWPVCPGDTCGPWNTLVCLYF